MSTVAANVTDRRGTSNVPAVDARLVLLAIGAVLFGVGMLRTVWLCDDAYITFRTIDNLVHGFGLRWNVDERVQAFTHPLWLAVLTPFVAVTHETYFTPLAISMALALAAIWLFLTRIATSSETRLIGLATFIFLEGVGGILDVGPGESADDIPPRGVLRRLPAPRSAGVAVGRGGTDDAEPRMAIMRSRKSACGNRRVAGARTVSKYGYAAWRNHAPPANSRWNPLCQFALKRST